MFNSNDFAKDREYRNRTMREAAREQLANEARSASTSNFNLADAVHNHHRLLVVVILVALFVLAQFLIPRAAAARDTTEAGDEPFASAMQAYRVGHYFYVAGSYERAIDEYQFAINNIPETIFAAKDMYWVIYWELGNAQFKADQPAEALESYKCFLNLMKEEASDEAVKFVDELETRISDGTYSTMTILEG